MSRADQILRAKQFAQGALVVAHDYYTDTKVAWNLVQAWVDLGYTFNVQSVVTGNVINHQNISQKVREYHSVRLAEDTFQQFVSVFEIFLTEVLRIWLTAYPQSLSGRQVKFEDILNAADKDSITDLVIGRELNEISYKKPAEWFIYLEQKAKLGCPVSAEIEQIAEAKATRDLLVHNQGVVNQIYLDKAGRLARFQLNQRIEIPDHYHRATWELLCKVVADIADSAASKMDV